MPIEGKPVTLAFVAPRGLCEVAMRILRNLSRHPAAKVYRFGADPGAATHVASGISRLGPRRFYAFVPIPKSHAFHPSEDAVYAAVGSE